MLKRLLIAVVLSCVYASAQQINPDQIRQALPGTYANTPLVGPGGTAAILAGSPTTLTASIGVFAAPKFPNPTVIVHGAGVGGAPLISTYTYVSPTQITLATPATTAVSAAWFTFGNDDTAGFQAAVSSAIAQGKSILALPPNSTGCYLITSPINVTKAQNISIVGSSPSANSCIMHAFKSAGPVLDFSGSENAAAQNLEVIAPNEDNSNSFATSAVFAVPIIGGLSPIHFSLLESLVQAGATPGAGAFIASGYDQVTVRQSQVYGSYAGCVLGNGMGTATVTSPFGTTTGGFGTTLVEITGNSTCGGRLDYPLELEGSDQFVLSGNVYIPMGGAFSDYRGTSNVGMTNGAMIEVNQAGGYEQDYLNFHGFRTENQSSSTGESSIFARGTQPPKGCSIEGDLETDSSGYMFNWNNLQMLDCNLNIGASVTVASIFHNVAAGGMTNVTALWHGSTFPTSLGNIGGTNFQGNSLNLPYSYAAQIAAITSTNIGQNILCNQGGSDCQTTNSTIAGNQTVGQNVNIAGTESVGNGSVSIGPVQNTLSNSSNFTAGSWGVTIGSCGGVTNCVTTAGGITDPWMTTTASQFTTQGSGTTQITDFVTPNLVPGTNYIIGIIWQSATGTSTASLSTTNQGSATVTVPLAWTEYCVQLQTGVSNLNQGIGITLGPTASLVYNIAGVFAVPGGNGNGTQVVCPAYLPTGSSAATTARPGVIQGAFATPTVTGTPTPGHLAIWSTGTPATLQDGGASGGSFTALTTDATSTATGGATEVVGLLNNALPSLSVGCLNWTGSAWAISTCGGGGGAVSSVSNSNGTLTISPTTGAVVGSLNLAHANTWTANQTSAKWIASTGFDISGATTAGHYLRNNGTDYVDNTIQVADVPTLNQNTTGSSGSVNTTVSTTNSNFSILSAANPSSTQTPATVANFTVNPLSGTVNIPGGVTVTGSVSTGASPPACATGTGIWCAAEAATAGTPAVSVDYIRASSTTHQFVISLDGVAEFVSAMNFPVQGTDTKVLSSGTISGGTGVGLCTDASGGATTTGCSSGGSPAFSVITGGTNNSANAMIVGSTSSLDFSGTGTIDANEVNGATAPTNSCVTGTNTSTQFISVSCNGTGNVLKSSSPSFNNGVNQENTIGTGTGMGTSIVGAALTAGDIYYQGASALALAEANSSSTLPAMCLANSTTDCIFVGVYRYSATQSWTVGGPIYVSDSTPGALTQTPPSTSGHFVQQVGIALAADTIQIGMGTILPAPGAAASNASTTVNGQTCALGAACTIPLSAINPQTATYPVVAGDFSNYKTITVASGSFTITLVASGSQPAAGQYINIINYGGGVVTVARSGQNINGGTSSIVLGAASALNPTSTEIWSDGTNYFATVDQATTGTVTSVATTSPLGGGTITGSGTLTCTTCVVASAPGVGIAHFAGSTQTVTSSTIVTADIAANAVTSAKVDSSVVTDSGNTTTTANQVAVSTTTAGAQKYIDFPDLKQFPAANCVNSVAGSGWSLGASGVVGCRAGTNNTGGFVTITDTSSSFAQFSLMIPADWDSGTRPYIDFQFSSASDTTNGHTVIPQIKVSCPTAANGTTSDDATFSAAQSSGTVTFGASAVANGFYNGSNVQIGSTQMTGCIAGGLMIVQVGRATDTATGNINFYGANITFPRLIVVQAN